MYIERIVRTEHVKERKIIHDFLEQFGLSFTGTPDYTIAIYCGDKIVGTGSLQGKVLKNFAVAENLQGEGILLKIISSLMSYAASKGLHSFQLFTKPQNVAFFQVTGFRLVANAQHYAALLEIGPEGIENWLEKVKTTLGEKINLGCIVMNANPFTLGHRALVEHAAKNCEVLIIFVVQEDASVFPFSDRLELVKEGTKDIKNIIVVPGGDYIISQATFPSYFVKGTDALEAQTRLDATIFAERIAPALDIKKRFVAKEPRDETTNVYNKALMHILPSSGIELDIIERSEVDGTPISASRVRQALAKDDFATVKKLVPETTFVYLQSEKGRQIIDKIKSLHGGSI